MDRNTITGLVLIFFLMLGWMYFMQPSPEEIQRQQQEQMRRDSLARLDSVRAPEQTTAAAERESAGTGSSATPSPRREQTIRSDEQPTPAQMGLFSRASTGDTVLTVVETPLYRATFTNIGGGPAKIVLKKFDTWDGQPVQMIGDTSHSAYNIGFLSDENYNVETDELVFTPLSSTDYIAVREGQDEELAYELKLDDGRRLLLVYRFFADTYEIDVQVAFEGLRSMVAGNNFDFGWTPRLNFTEKDRTQEALPASAYLFAGGELEQFNLEEAGSDQSLINGKIDWVATRTKFFTQIIKTGEQTDAALLSGQVNGPVDAQSTRHHYKSSIRTDIPADEVADFQLYVGPLSWDDLKNYDEHAYDMVDVGFSWLRWFSDPLVRYVIIPFINYVGSWVGNYGIVIILFAIAIKLVLYPLTKKSFESMAAMRELQPEMKAIQEKYKDNPEKQQKATMKLYKEAGANPLGGCLPNLLQFPILITLWRFFQNSIEIRQKSFLWASDLSAPDVVINLPFEIPFLGDHLAGFVLLMTATMVVQTQLTGSPTGMGGGGGMSGSQMKVFQYFLPIMLLFFFNSFAAGLSLYYLIYNVMSIGQQFLINKNIDHDKMMDKVEGKGKKKGRKGKK